MLTVFPAIFKVRDSINARNDHQAHRELEEFAREFLKSQDVSLQDFKTSTQGLDMKGVRNITNISSLDDLQARKRKTRDLIAIYKKFIEANESTADLLEQGVKKIENFDEDHSQMLQTLVDNNRSGQNRLLERTRQTVDKWERFAANLTILEEHFGQWTSDEEGRVQFTDSVSPEVVERYDEALNNPVPE